MRLLALISCVLLARIGIVLADGPETDVKPTELIKMIHQASISLMAAKRRT